MIDVKNIGKDFIPQRRIREPVEQVGQPFTPPGVPPLGQPPSGGVGSGYGGAGQPPTGGFGGGQPPGGLGLSGTMQPLSTIGNQFLSTRAGGPGTAREQEFMEGQVGAGAPEAGGFPYPEQWQTATDIYGQLAGGMPGMTPEYAEQAWLPYQRQGQEQAMQAREQAGLGGMRWSTPLAGQLESVWGGASERFGSEMERMRMQDIVGQRATMLGAAGGLGGLGGQYAQLPLTVAQTQMGLGYTQQQMQQQQLDREREEWLRQQPEYSPLLQYQAGGAQMPTGPEMYGPSMGGQMFDIAGQMGMAQQMGLFGGGGGGTPTAPLGGGAYPPEWGQFR